MGKDRVSGLKEVFCLVSFCSSFYGSERFP